MKVYKNENSKLKGATRHGKKDLDFFTLFKSTINVLDEEDKPLNQSIVLFRFHSSIEFCQMSIDQHVEIHGGIHVRGFTYNGVDKTESELIDWVLNEKDLVGNDGVSTVYNAKEVK